MAASVTVLAIGPAVCLVLEMGMIPVLLTPTVGLIPTIPLTEAGHTTDPSVSVPSNTQRLAAGNLNQRLNRRIMI
jgi:hypothetical protein